MTFFLNIFLIQSNSLHAEHHKRKLNPEMPMEEIQDLCASIIFQMKQSIMGFSLVAALISK